MSGFYKWQYVPWDPSLHQLSLDRVLYISMDIHGCLLLLWVLSRKCHTSNTSTGTTCISAGYLLVALHYLLIVLSSRLETHLSIILYAPLLAFIHCIHLATVLTHTSHCTMITSYCQLRTHVMSVILSAHYHVFVIPVLGYALNVYHKPLHCCIF
jgi:hypothetical protein